MKLELSIRWFRCNGRKEMNALVFCTQDRSAFGVEMVVVTTIFNARSVTVHPKQRFTIQKQIDKYKT